MACCQQELVAIAQRHVERLGELQDHVGAGARAAGLEEAQMPRRDARLEGEVELAQPPAGAPLAQQRPDLRRCL